MSKGRDINDKNINYGNLKKFKENLNDIIPKRVTLTQAEYDLLTYEEKHNGTVYFISDGVANISETDKEYIDSQDQSTLDAAKKYTDDTLDYNYQKVPEEGSGSLLNSLTDVQCDQSYNDHVEIYLDLYGTNEVGVLSELTDSSGFDLVGATSEHAGVLTATDKVKLDGIETGANAYNLPEATSDTLGGVKTGDNITNTSGTISLTKSNVTTALGFTPPTNGFRKYSTTFTYTSRDSQAPIGSCTIPYNTSDGFLIITSEYEQYIYLITCRSSININKIYANSSETPIGTRNGSNNTITISNIPYIGSMTGSLTVYSFS